MRRNSELTYKIMAYLLVILVGIVSVNGMVIITEAKEPVVVESVAVNELEDVTNAEAAVVVQGSELVKVTVA